MQKSVALALVALVALTFAACSSPCQDLADRICNCQPAGSLRDNCKTSVKNQIGNATQRPSDADQATCSKLLSTCPDPENDPSRCEVMQTQAGREACGLAFPLPDGGADAGTP
jgi:hypothetical protein